MKGKGKIDDEILPRLQHSSLCRHDVSGPLDRGRLRARVAAGDVTLGTFIGTASPVAAEVCAAAGFDWLLLDLEHGAGGEEQIRATVPAAAAYGVPTVVRVESDARVRIGRVLDAGAAGVMLPRLDTADQVRAAVAHLCTTRRAVTPARRPTTGLAGSDSTLALSTGQMTRLSASCRSSPRGRSPPRRRSPRSRVST